MILFNPVMKFNPEGADSNRAHGPIDKLDPYTYASKKQAPCIMLFGTDDRLLDGAEQYKKVSEKVGNQCKIVTYEGERHGFYNYEDGGNTYYDLTLKEMDSFLVKLGWILEK